MKKYGALVERLHVVPHGLHGRSASLVAGQKKQAEKIVAVCVDCHGVHDIARVKDAGSKVLQSNLQATCAKCHPGAPPNFPAAWLSHYAPSPKKAPLVWATALFYKILIPLMIGGLVLQVLLHLWRVVVNDDEDDRPFLEEAAGRAPLRDAPLHAPGAHGFPQKFYEAGWAAAIVNAIAGSSVSGSFTGSPGFSSRSPRSPTSSGSRSSP